MNILFGQSPQKIRCNSSTDKCQAVSTVKQHMYSVVVVFNTQNNRNEGGGDGQYRVFMPCLSGNIHTQSGKRPVGRKSCPATVFHSLSPAQLHRRPSNMPSTYKKDKPWDTDDIDKWNVRYKDKKRGILHFKSFSFANLNICDRRNHSKPMTTSVGVSQRNRPLLLFSPNTVRFT